MRTASKIDGTDWTDAAWMLVAPLLPPARSGGRPCTTDLRAFVNVIFYLLRTGCQWRLLPREFPPWGTVCHYLQGGFNTRIRSSFSRFTRPWYLLRHVLSRRSSQQKALVGSPPARSGKA